MKKILAILMLALSLLALSGCELDLTTNKQF